MNEDRGGDTASELRAGLEAARRELAETAEALAARVAAPATPTPPAQVAETADIVPAASALPVPYRPPSSRRRVALGVALGLAAVVLRRLAR